MFLVFPWLAWLAAVVSGVLLAVLWTDGDLSRRAGTLLLSWFLAAGYCQFSAVSAGISVAGLVLQTILAVCLIIRWKVESAAI
jgi:hypothetical protein